MVAVMITLVARVSFGVIAGWHVLYYDLCVVRAVYLTIVYDVPRGRTVEHTRSVSKLLLGLDGPLRDSEWG